MQVSSFVSSYPDFIVAYFYATLDKRMADDFCTKGLQNFHFSFNSSCKARHVRHAFTSLQGYLLLPFWYLIPIATQAFIPHRRTRSSWTPYVESFPSTLFAWTKRVAPQVVLFGLTDFTPTRSVPSTSPGPKPDSFSSTFDSLLPNFTRDTSSRLRML